MLNRICTFSEGLKHDPTTNCIIFLSQCVGLAVDERLYSIFIHFGWNLKRNGNRPPLPLCPQYFLHVDCKTVPLNTLLHTFKVNFQKISKITKYDKLFFHTSHTKNNSNNHHFNLLVLWLYNHNMFNLRLILTNYWCYLSFLIILAAVDISTISNMLAAKSRRNTVK